MARFKRLYVMMALWTAPAAIAQSAHWGVQAEGSYGSFLGFIIDRFSDQLEGYKVQEANTSSFSAGLVRFHANGSPNFSVQYFQMNADASAGRPPDRADGTGAIHGVMASKHFNFFSREKVSGGVIVGGGIGKGEIDYVISHNGTFLKQEHEDHATPVFELLASVDIRPVKQLSIGPYYGFLMGGAAVRFHFR